MSDLVKRLRDGCNLQQSDGERAADRIEELEAENEMLRGLVSSAESIFDNCQISAGICCCGDNMEGHSDPMSCGHSPVDMGAYSTDQWISAISKQGETK